MFLSVTSFLFSCPLTFILSLKYCLLLCGCIDSHFIFSTKKKKEEAIYLLCSFWSRMKTDGRDIEGVEDTALSVMKVLLLSAHFQDLNRFSVCEDSLSLGTEALHFTVFAACLMTGQ